MKMQYNAGLSGEAAAEQYLCARGMRVLARRYRGQDGEIDLIMQDGEYIVFVEVKARPAAQKGQGLLAITPAKQARMKHAAQSYLVQQNELERPVRFDALEITRDGILHIPNAFW